MDWVFAHDAFYCLHIFFLLSCALKFLLCFCSSLCLSYLVSSSWHPKSLSLLKTRFVVVLHLLLFLLTLFGSVMRRHVLTSLRTFLTGQFIWNAMSFYLIFQTLLFPVLLALRDGFLKTRGVPTCSYMVFILICTPSIPLCLGLVRYSVVHIL